MVARREGIRAGKGRERRGGCWEGGKKGIG